MVQLTPRDRRLLHWINGHGFVTADQAARWMDVCDRIGRRRLLKLVDEGYLQRDRFGVNDPHCHWLTKDGWAVAGDALPPPKKVNRVTYFHDTALVDLSQKLVAHTRGDFIPERRLKSENRAKSRWRNGRFVGEVHTPDGLLHIEGKKPFAIELEMTVKERRRLEKIISSYACTLDYEAVWYFVSDGEVKRAVERAIGSRPCFQIFPIQF